MCHFNSTCIIHVIYQLIADVGRSDFETGLSPGVVCYGNLMKANKSYFLNEHHFVHRRPNSK